MENKIISIDITPDNSAEYTANAGVMWEHNATLLKFNIDKAFVGDYRYYIEYRSLMGTKVRTEYLELNTEDNTITYNVPVTMSSLKGVDCWFNIVSIDSDGNTQQIIKSAKFTLTFDYSPDTDNHLCKVNDFSINSLLEAIRLGTFKGDKGEKGDTGEKGDKGDKGDRGDDGEVTAKYVSKNFSNALKGTASGASVSMNDVSPMQHELKCRVESKNLIPYPYKTKSQKINGVTFTVNDDSSVYIVGTATAQAAFPLADIDLGDKSITAMNAVATNNGYTISKRLVYNSDTKIVYIVVNKDITVDETVYPQAEIGNELTEYTPYVETSTVNIIRVGKNLFDISKIVNGTGVKNNGDGTLTVKGTGVSGSLPNTLKDYAPSLKAGEQYILSADTTSEKKYIYLKGDAQSSWYFGKPRIVTVADLNAPVGWYATDDNSTDTVSNIQIELGATATEYEQYNGQTTVANEDGTVDGLLSASPNMVVTTDTDGVVITCEYNKDTNKVIENLVNAIISLGGNV